MVIYASESDKELFEEKSLAESLAESLASEASAFKKVLYVEEGCPKCNRVIFFLVHCGAYGEIRIEVKSPENDRLLESWFETDAEAAAREEAEKAAADDKAERRSGHSVRKTAKAKAEAEAIAKAADEAEASRAPAEYPVLLFAEVAGEGEDLTLEEVPLKDPDEIIAHFAAATGADVAAFEAGGWSYGGDDDEDPDWNWHRGEGGIFS